jgi:hypothetical protein
LACSSRVKVKLRPRKTTSRQGKIIVLELKILQ